MHVLSLVAIFFAGALLSNCIPHLASGLRGERFPTPFAKPPGQGLSSSLTNALWGSLNVFAGLSCYAAAPFTWGMNLASVVFAIGFVASSVFLALHFEKVREGRS